MIIYKCRITGDELFTDAYKITYTDDGLVEVEGKMITKTSEDIDDSLIGGNASAEEVCEGTDASSQTGADIVLNHRLVCTPPFTKKTLMSYLKDYVKLIKAQVEAEHPNAPEKVKEFQEEAQKAAKKLISLLGEKKDLECFTGESMNPQGAVGFLDFREDGLTPYMIYVKCGLDLEKY